MAKLFFLLSGEHENLPASELEAILEAEGYRFGVLEELDQVVRIEADPKCVEAIERRAAFTRLCGLELFTSEATDDGVMLEAMNPEDTKEVLKSGDSFAIRIKRVKNYAKRVDSMALERKLGELVRNTVVGAKVNLRSPNKTLIGILTSDKIIFGLRIAEVKPKTFVERRPRRKPFFHPSAMPAKLARCMVNLAKPRVDDLVFDPLCGTGSMLIEAALIGCRVIGLDVQQRMVRGSLRNMAFFHLNPEGLVVADAGKPPVAKVDCVVTDPPYGRSSTTLKRTTKQIVEEVLMAVNGMLTKGRHVCIAAPTTLNISSVGIALGYKHLQSHFVYVHRTLTREIAVFERV